MARKRAKDTKAPAARVGAVGDGRPTLPLWVPALVFVALTLWLFRGFVFSDRMLYGNDTLGLGYVARAFYAESLKQLGTFPLWNPRLLGGTPFLEALSGGDSLYPPSALLLLVMEPYRALGWKLVLHVLAAGFFMFGWARALGVSRPAALVAGVGYMLAPFLVTLVHPGHDGKLFVTALTPLMFWAVERHFVRPGPATFSAIGLVVALVLLTTHFQMAYFLFGGVGLYAIFRTVETARGGVSADGPGASAEGTRRRLAPAGARFGLFLAAAVAGAAGAGVQFLPSVEYVTEYSRRVQTTQEAAGEAGRDWSSSWSLHPEEAMSQLVPEFAGSDANGSAWTSGTYWGRNVFKDNHEGAGVLLLLLAAASFAGGARRSVRWFFVALGSTALLFALGTHTPVWGAFYALVPGIRLFRAPSQAMFLFGFAAATLAALGVERILRLAAEDDEGGWKGVQRVLWGGTGILAALSLLAASGLLTSLWTAAVYRDLDPSNAAALETLKPFLVRGAFLSAVLVAAVAGLAWAARRSWLASGALVAGLALLVSVDQLRVDASFVQTLDFHEWSRPDPNLQALLDRERGSTEPYRLLSFARGGQDVTPAMHGIELAAGHHPNDLSRYRELIGMVGSGEPENLFNPNIRRLLNVRYILWPDWQRGPVAEEGVVSRTTQGGQPYETLLADAGLPRARLVAAATVKADSEAVPYMLSAAFDPAAEVVLSEAPPVELDGGPVSGDVRWEERTPSRLRLAVTSDRAALLVVADNWFPAWHATVNGAEAPVLRAYHTLRAVPVPAGESTVEMTYRSALLIRSLWLSLVALGALVGVGVWGAVRDRGRSA
ncbi:MAG: hypothetical protein Q8N53_04320 [Longimicrobiales bacterium]|nr:hypothetical protein [Longimicrobiales bacterium]